MILLNTFRLIEPRALAALSFILLDKWSRLAPAVQVGTRGADRTANRRFDTWRAGVA